MPEITQPHLVLWGERDGWIAPADLKTMAAAMPDCRLVVVPGIGHSMNLGVAGTLRRLFWRVVRRPGAVGKSAST